MVPILSTDLSANNFQFWNKTLKDGGTHRRVHLMRPEYNKDYNQDINWG